MIDILVPVLRRPQNALPLMESIASATKSPYRVLFLCSPGDDEQIEASKRTGAEVMVMSFPPERSDYPRKMNVGFWATESEWVFLGADDLEFKRGWDQVALQAGGDVIGTNDRANGQVMRGEFGTHCLVSRRYVTEQGAAMDGPGVLIHEGYDHNFCDRELCGIAMWRGAWRFARGSIVRHRHPNWRTAPMDSTYEKGLSTFAEDQKVYFSRAHLWEYVGASPAERRASEAMRYTEAR